MSTRAIEPVRILLVDDSEPDIDLTREALADTKVPHLLDVVRTGDDALTWLRREAKFANAPRPDVIILDLNLPRMDGREVLAAIKSSPELMTIPVIVLTTARQALDIESCYKLHANAFVTKAINLEDFQASMRAIAAFWLQTAKLPRS